MRRRQTSLSSLCRNDKRTQCSVEKNPFSLFVRLQFLPRAAMKAGAVNAIAIPSVRPSVRLSHSCTALKRIQLCPIHGLSWTSRTLQQSSIRTRTCVYLTRTDRNSKPTNWARIKERGTYASRARSCWYRSRGCGKVYIHIWTFKLF